VSGFASHKQAVFEVTVAPTADDSVQTEDVFDQGRLKIVEQTIDEKDQTTSKFLIKKSGAKTKQKK